MQVNTNENTLIAKIVGLVMALVIVGIILVPIVSDAEKDTMTGTNPYYFRMSEIGDETITLSYDADTQKPLYNGELTNFTNSNGEVITSVAIISDTFVISTTGQFWYYYFIYEGTGVQIWSTATGAATAVATIGNGSMNLYINESTSYDLPYTFCYIPDNNGDHIMSQEHTNGFFKKSDDIVVSITLRTNYGVATGTVDSLTTDFHATDGTPDTDSYVFGVTYDTQTVGLTELCKTHYDSYRYILPLNYTYEESTEYAYLYSIIPIFVVIGLLIGIVGVMFRSK